MNDQDRPTNIPTVLVVILALLGLAILPQGQGSRGGGPASNAPEASGPTEGSGVHSSSAETGERGKDLGPLELLKDHSQGGELSDRGQGEGSEGQKGDERKDLLWRASGLKFLIVMVPDPDETSVSHEFDSTLAAVLRAGESERYVAERYSFPWDPEARVKPATSPTLSIGQSSGVTLALTIGKAVDKGLSWPGAILCRRVPPTKADDVTDQKADGAEELLLLLLVPETPTWGVDKRRLVEAIRIVKEHTDIQLARNGQKVGEWIRIVGPMYSGSLPSLAAVIKGCWIGGPISSAPFPSPRIAVDCSLNTMGSSLRFTIINGSAQSLPRRPVKKIFGRGKEWVELWSTVHQREDLVSALLDYLQTIAPPIAPPDRVALLVEAGSPFGVVTTNSAGRPADRFERKGSAPKDQEKTDKVLDVFSFPMGISRIRREYTAKGYYRPNEPLRLASPERLSLQAMTGRTGDRDLMPVFSPGTAAVEEELVLAQILQELERGHYTTIGIVATNVYDQLFLAYKVRQVCPDARLTFTSSSSLSTHHDIVAYLRGSLVVSTYPLQLANQSRSPAPAVGESDVVKVPRVGFPHYYSEGIYNATVANLAEMVHSDDQLDQVRPALLDYRFPGDTEEYKAAPHGIKLGALVEQRRGAAPGVPQGSVPPIWVSVVGERGLYPLEVIGDKPSENADEGAPLYRSPYPPTKPVGSETLPRLDPNWVGVYLAVAGMVAIGAAWYLWVCLAAGAGTARGRRGWLHLSARHRELINSRPGRRLAALAVSAALAQVVLLGLPAWGYARLGVTLKEGPMPLSATWLGEALALAVGVLAGAASLVSLFRVVQRHDRGPSQARDRLFNAAVALVAALQVLLPLAFIAFYLTQRGDTAIWNVADLRLDCERMSRLTNGVTPLVPLLLLGLAYGFALLGGWRRMELQAHLGAVKVTHGATVLPDSSAGFGPVRSDLQLIQKTLDAPLKVGTHANPLLLPALVLFVLAGASAVGRLPASLERRELHWLILLAFAMTTLMIVIRLIELIGLWRLNRRLLQAVAQLPMVRAFDRLPTRLTLFGRAVPAPSQPAASAAEAVDPLIDRQFQALAAGYGRVRPALDAHGILTSTDGDPIDRFLPRSHAAGAHRILPADWWRVVDVLLPILSPFWERRSATTAYAAGTGASSPDADAEWPGLNKPTPDDRPIGDQSGPHWDRATAEGRTPAAVMALREPAVVQARRPGPTAQPEEVYRWLRDAEDFTALVLARQLAWLRRYCSSIETFLVVGLLTLTLAVTSYPFQPRGQMLTILGMLASVTAATVVVIAVQISRDDVTSRINKTTPNRFNFDRQFVTTLVTVVMPLVGLLAALSYGTSDLIRSWLEPLFR